LALPLAVGVSGCVLYLLEWRRFPPAAQVTASAVAAMVVVAGGMWET
jgi:hypothetical protein